MSTLIKKLLFLYLLIFFLLGAYGLLTLSDYSIFKIVIKEEAPQARRIEKLKSWFAHKRIDLWLYQKKCSIKVLSSEKKRLILFLLVEEHQNGSFSKENNLTSLLIEFMDVCNINTIDKESGLAPLHSAIVLTKINLVKYLIKNGADVEMRVTRSGKAQGMNAIGFTKLLIERQHDETKITLLIKLLNTLSD